jgi:uncharacterized protein YbjT (DUF2867 family)
MHIVVSTPNGHIGRPLTRKLLDADAQVTMIARNPAKVDDLATLGARVEQGSLDDADFLTRVTAGADALFWLTPPDYLVDDLRARQNAFGKAAADAIKAGGVRRVVNISSVGAQSSSGNGAINGLHDVEQHLNAVAPDLTHLRPTFFMENFLEHLDSIRDAGAIFMPIKGDVRLPMVATRDIADVAAARLLDASWSGQSVLGVHGPADLTFDEVAAVFSDVLGREVKHQKVPVEATREALIGMGLRPATADTMLEMYDAIDTGRLEIAEPRTPETTTPTTFEQFVREVVKPMIGQVPASH